MTVKKLQNYNQLNTRKVKERVFMKKILNILKHNSILVALFAMVIVFVVSNVKNNGIEEKETVRILDSVTPESEIAYIEVNDINLLKESSDTIRFTEVEIKVELSTQEDTEAEETKEAEETEQPVEEVVATPARVIPCSDADYINFLKIVEAETTGGDLMSKILVANVIINRVKNPYFPNTVTEVIFQGNGEQFQPVMDGRFYTVPVTALTFEAVDRALYGEDYSMGAYFFAATASAGPGSWHDIALKRLFEYGGHVYFSFK